jgi:hypothetical protein
MVFILWTLTHEVAHEYLSIYIYIYIYRRVYFVSLLFIYLFSIFTPLFILGCFLWVAREGIVEFYWCSFRCSDMAASDWSLCLWLARQQRFARGWPTEPPPTPKPVRRVKKERKALYQMIYLISEVLCLYIASFHLLICTVKVSRLYNVNSDQLWCSDTWWGM